MTYAIISAQVRLETGPTRVGDDQSDPDLMRSLDAHWIRPMGENVSFWRTELPPRGVVNRLAAQGFRVVSTTGVGQTFVVTLFKE
ncbi:hypothetical protein TCAL_00365 [Tigriopus californicus]|uniref:GTP cyclohydrolase 1 feedback regulatory protein n=1 Tax=Tigriopus californicus TaxID=6832 RepID=A0A553NDF5_TIGCA|nr:hypothetical protein TCAL_00365 [Tigriopus californicus]